MVEEFYNVPIHHRRWQAEEDEDEEEEEEEFYKADMHHGRGQAKQAAWHWRRWLSCYMTTHMWS